MANVRAAYAEVVTSYLTDNHEKTVSVKITSNTSDWKSDSTAELKGHKYSDMINGATGGTLAVSVDKNGKVTIGSTTIEEGETTAAAGH